MRAVADDEGLIYGAGCLRATRSTSKFGQKCSSSTMTTRVKIAMTFEVIDGRGGQRYPYRE